MSGSSIAQKVKAGLKKAYNATGGGTAKTYLINQNNTESTDPRVGGTSGTPTYTELVNAIWKTIDNTLIDNTNILQGDMELTIDADVVVSVNDKISYNQVDTFNVIQVNPVRPTNVLLEQKLVVRAV